MVSSYNFNDLVHAILVNENLATLMTKLVNENLELLKLGYENH